VKVITSGKVVLVDGTVDVPQQLERVNAVVDAFQWAEPELVFKNLVRVDPVAWSRVAERVEREIGSPEITVRVVGQTVAMEGVADSDFEADRAVEIARAYFRPYLAAHARYAEKGRVVAASAPSPAAPPPEARRSATGYSTSAVPADEAFSILDLLRVRPRGAAPTKTAKR
jgi:hypothetical protein